MISVVIPVHNDAPALDRLLTQLEHLKHHLEVIVVDGSSIDGTSQVLERFPWVETIQSEACRGKQLNRGAERASHPIILFLHADTQLQGKWIRAIQDAADHPDFAFGAFRFKTDHPSPVYRVLELFVNIRTRYRRLPYGDQGIFVRKKHFWGVGGFPDTPLMEDVELVWKLQWRGRFTFLSQAALTSSRKWRRDGLLRRSIRNIRLYRLYKKGVDAADLADLYYPPPLNSIMMFCKIPVPGKVKTRLGASIGMDKACEVYDKLTKHTLGIINGAKVPSCKKVVYFTPKDKRPEAVAWLGIEPLYAPQSSGDLGDRMLAAFREQFDEGAEKVIIVGTDCPGLTPSILKTAFEALDDHDTVIGPTEDGGYYLLGMQTLRPLLFQSIPWSSENVYKQTLARFEENDLSWFELPKLRDVDTESDLEAAKKVLGGLG